MAIESNVTENTTTEQQGGKPAKKTLKEARAENSEMLMKSMRDGKAAWQVPEKVESVGMPQNLRGQAYEGINAIVLATAGINKGFDDPRWISNSQINTSDRRIKKGEKATFIEVADYFKRDNDGNKIRNADGKAETLGKPNVYVVAMFNVGQIVNQGVFYPRELTPNETAKEPNFEKAENIIKNASVQINHSLKSGEWSKYDAVTDTIEMPPADSFQSKEGYYAEVLHQLAHATGHETRQNREGVYQPMGAGFSGVPQEELRGEIASFFMRQELGFKLDPDHTKTSVYAEEKYIRDSVLKNKDGSVYNTGILPIICNDANRMKNEVMKMGKELTKEQINEQTAVEKQHEGVEKTQEIKRVEIKTSPQTASVKDQNPKKPSISQGR